MTWIEIFKIYNIKIMKKEKLLLLFTVFTILITITISMVIPQLTLENKKYLYNNLSKINGGDLSIVLRGNSMEVFQEKIEELKNRGLDVTSSDFSNCYYNKGDNKIFGTIVSGEYFLKEDEIILQSSIANNLHVNKGDYVSLDTQGNGIKKYKVKDIESMALGVDHDSELVGYGKIQKTNDLHKVKDRQMVYISGEDGEKLKEELKEYDNKNMYTSIKDKEKEVQGQIKVQSIALGTLSTVSYIVSALVIISTTMMIIIKRKKDIAILRMLSIDIKKIKKALRFEIFICIIIPIILSSLISYKISSLILSYNNIYLENITMDNVNIILKSAAFNLMVFLVFINLSLSIVKEIKPLYIIRKAGFLLNKKVKKIILKVMILLNIFLLIYSFNSEAKISAIGIFIIFLIIMLFLVITLITVKLLSLIKLRNNIWMYSIKSIKNNFFSFIVVLLSLSLTLWFILIGFNLKESVKDNVNNSLNNVLPYNYIVTTENIENTDKVLKENKNVISFNKLYGIEGSVQNNVENSMFSSININEVNKEEYNLKYKIIQGQDLFKGEKNGVIISDEMRDKGKLEIGDILNVTTKKGDFQYFIKGVYNSGKMNSISVLKENVEIGQDIGYEVKASTSDFIDSLKTSMVINIDSIGEGLSNGLTKFLKIFRFISVISVLSIVLFNINMVYMEYSQNEKNQEIIKALGLGKRFLIKSEILKHVLIVIISSMLSLTIYYLSIKLALSAMFDTSLKIDIKLITITIIIGLVISVITFSLIIKKILKKKDIGLIRYY